MPGCDSYGLEAENAAATTKSSLRVSLILMLLPNVNYLCNLSNCNCHSARPVVPPAALALSPSDIILAWFIIVCVKNSPETKGFPLVIKSQAGAVLPLSQNRQDLRLQSPGKHQPHQNFLR